MLNFNPRAYVRHDPQFKSRYWSQEFQSTCLREARLSVEYERPEAGISIHVPT